MLGEFVSSTHYASLLQRGQRNGAGWLQFDDANLLRDYNRRPFVLEHRLDQHPLFNMAPLFDLCRRLPPRAVKFRAGEIPPDADFDSSYAKFRQGLTLNHTLDNFEPLHAYLCIYTPEQDPQYRPEIEGLLAEIAAHIHPLDPHITWYSTYVFLSAQGAVTPYHMDREMNFLLQIRGEKTADLWNQADPVIMSPAQKDRLLAYDGTRPPYKPEFEARALHFALRPGLGVHHPFIAPHRVWTHSNLSISLAFTFRTRQSDQRTAAHQCNARLRRLGLQNPKPVGESAWVDSAKALTLHALQRLRHPLQHAEH
ncbi:MAG: transcription factor jumonji JmjC domain-containing protein [Burkholderiaceae bacterium]|nr:transcription factor jumonji JmjC domain-containing protein [Burkholderiaceae bacterium]